MQVLVNYLQEVLISAYVVLSIAAFCYGVGSIRGVFRVALHRKPDTNPLYAFLLGWLNPDRLSPLGQEYRRRLFHSISKTLLCLGGLVVIVVIGVLLQE